MIVYDVWYFDGRGRREAGFDRDTVLPSQVRAPYAIAIAKTGARRILYWAGGRWHEERPAGIPATVRP